MGVCDAGMLQGVPVLTGGGEKLRATAAAVAVALLGERMIGKFSHIHGKG